MTRPVIDPEFAAVFELPPESEWDRLRKKIETETHFEPLVVWEETNILLDGHTRWAICERFHLTHKVKTRRMSFPDRGAAWQWVVDNQLARRNLSAAQKLVYIGMKYNAAKREQGGDRRSKPHGEALKSGDAAARVAKQHKVSRATVQRAGKVAEAVDKLPPKERAKALKGKVPTKTLAAQAGPRTVAAETFDSWRAVPLLKLVTCTPRVSKALDALGVVTCGDWADALDADRIRGLNAGDVKSITEHVAELRTPPEQANGKQAGVNWPAFYSHYGAMVRAVSDFHRGAGTLNGTDHTAAKEQAGKFLDLFKSQVATATGKPIPGH